MTLPSVTPSEVRSALLLRSEIALLDVRHEAAFATGHPLFAANMAADRIALEAGARLPRKEVPIVLYDVGEGLVALAADRLGGLEAVRDQDQRDAATAWCRGRWDLGPCPLARVTRRRKRPRQSSRDLPETSQPPIGPGCWPGYCWSTTSMCHR